jgi:hypothetical protein
MSCDPLALLHVAKIDNSGWSLLWSPDWRIEREGAFSLFAIAMQGGDASYVGCVTVEKAPFAVVAGWTS